MKKTVTFLLILCLLCGSAALSETVFEMPEGIYFGMSYWDLGDVVFSKYDLINETNTYVSVNGYDIYKTGENNSVTGLELKNIGSFDEAHEKLVALYGEPQYSSREGTAAGYTCTDAYLYVFTQDCYWLFDKYGESAKPCYSPNDEVSDDFIGVIKALKMIKYEQWELSLADGSGVLLHHAQYTEQCLRNDGNLVDYDAVKTVDIVRVVPIHVQ